MYKIGAYEYALFCCVKNKEEKEKMRKEKDVATGTVLAGQEYYQDITRSERTVHLRNKS
jgi:hypothetical protein